MKCLKCLHILDEGDALVKCDGCNRFTHRGCTDLTASELKVLDLKSGRQLKYFCNDCQEGLLRIPKLFKIIDSLQEEVKDLRTKLDSMSQSSSAHNSFDMLVEMEDRVSRACSVMITDIDESKKSDPQLRASEDIVNVKKVLSKILPDVKVCKAIRLGRKVGNRTRLLKVVVGNRDEVRSILRNKRDADIPDGVKIFADRTKLQREQYNEVKLQLAKLKEDGVTNKTIKFIRNTPMIVDVAVSKRKN